VRACAEPRGDDADTWISPEIQRLYNAVFDIGYAHSIEAWRGDQLVGGLYGVAIGGAFFAESKFSREPYASQVCYAWLAAHLRERRYRLLDVQFVNPHLEQFGVVEVQRDEYLVMLQDAIRRPTTWR